MLTAVEVRNAKPRGKPYKLFDGAGLYLEVTPNGARYWRLKYRFGGKEKRLALGVYPRVSIAEARERRDGAHRLLRDGGDPSALKQAAKREAKLSEGSAFRIVAEEWISKQRSRWQPGHAEAVARSLDMNIFPELGHRPIEEIEAPELRAVLQKIENRGAHEVRQRVQQRVGAVFRYGIATGRCLRNPAPDLRGAFTSPRVRHYSALNEKELPEFLAKLDAYDGEPVTKFALRLLLLTFVRTGELRAAEWAEFDEDSAEWRIPAARMKMRDVHVVPLSRQALLLLKKLKPLTGAARFVFPHWTNPARCMSENTILGALYRMGYHGRATGHGFRGTASTILNEMGFAPDCIERQLAHAERNKVRAAYNHAQYLPERRRMMQRWPDTLDALAIGKPVAKLRRVV
jgi:integrase